MLRFGLVDYFRFAFVVVNYGWLEYGVGVAACRASASLTTSTGRRCAATGRRSPRRQGRGKPAAQRSRGARKLWYRLAFLAEVDYSLERNLLLLGAL